MKTELDLTHRIERKGMYLWEGGDTLIYKTKSGERLIPADKWWINKRTPVGEDAIVYEVKPYGGKMELCSANIIGVYACEKHWKCIKNIKNENFKTN